MAECLELTKDSLYMDQLIRDLPMMRDWIELHKLNNRFFLYNEYKEPRYCIETHVEGAEFVVHLIKLTDDVEFFGDLFKQIKHVMPTTKMPIKIVVDKKDNLLWKQLKWKGYKEEVLTDEYNRKTYIYAK